jgi:predicted permease
MLRELLSTARLKIRAAAKRRQLDRDLKEELAFHLSMREERNRADGLGTRAARESAQQVFGNPTSIIERCREIWMLASLERIWRDVRYSVRSFVRTPGFTIVVVLMMAFGIGANAALFSVFHAVLLKPLPFTQPNRLVSLYERDVLDGGPRNVVSGGVFEQWQREAKSFEVMSVVGEDGANLSDSRGQLPEFIGTRLCTYGFFPMLGVRPALGRLFSADDDRPQANATALLTFKLWRRRFAADRSIIGKSIFLDARPYTVIGVLPASFIYPDARTELWLPVYHERPARQMHSLGSHEFYVWARLAPGVSLGQAYAELDAIQRGMRKDHPDELIGKGVNVFPLQDDLAHNVKSSLYLLLGAVGCLLLIVCLNVASLFVARTASRRTELRIRAALGGSRARLLAEQVTGTLVLSTIGGAFAIFLAFAGLRWILTSRPGIPGAAAIEIDRTVLLFAFLVAVISGIVAGFLPALYGTRIDLAAGLLESSRSVAGGQSQARLRKFLLAAEVALTVVLLSGAGLLLKSFAVLRAVDMGCATRNVLTMSVSLPDARYAKPAQVTEFFSELLDRVRAMPGASAAGAVTTLPGNGHWMDNTFTIEGRPPLAPDQELDAVIRAADPGYFAAMNIPLLRGRYFTDSERLDQAKAVIVSESFAREFFPQDDPLGKRVNIGMGAGGAHHEIVGIVRDVRSWLNRPVEPTMYFPLYSGNFGYGSLVVRSANDVTRLALPIQREIARLDRSLAVSDVLTMDEIIGKSTADAKFSAMLVLLFAGLALLLAAVGLYGVLSYLVTQRTGEIGVRMALGAQRPTVMGLMLLDGLRPAASGLLLGTIGAAVSAELMQSELFGVQPLELPIFAAVIFLVLTIATVACALPAWRASRLDPATTLRGE